MRRRTDNPDLSSKYPLELRELAEKIPCPRPRDQSRPPILEDQIDILRGLDYQRRISADLRDYGVNVLNEWIKDAGPSETSATDKIDGERNTLLAVAAIDVLYRCSKEPTEEIETLLKSLVTTFSPARAGPETSSAPAAKGHPSKLADSPFLQNLDSHHVSVLLAAEFMQALAAAPISPTRKRRSYAITGSYGNFTPPKRPSGT